MLQQAITERRQYMNDGAILKKKVLLVFPRFKYPSGELPTGLATIASYLRQALPDLDLTLLDTSFQPSFDHVEHVLSLAKPDITGIFMDILMATDALRVAQIAKKHGSTVIAGGPHATMMPGEVLSHDCIDAVCIGEGERTLQDYIQTFYEDKCFERVQGIWFKINGNVHKTPPRQFINDIDQLPSPAFDLFDMESYVKNFFQLDSVDPRLRGVSMTVSRGCPYHCTFCQPTVQTIMGKKVRIRKPESVIADIQHLQRQYKIDAFYFADDLIAVVPGWLARFCELLKNENIHLAWACNTRADTMDYKTMKLMKSAGLVKIKVGIESISERIRNGLYNKKIKDSDINRLLDNARKLNIQVKGFFMLGAPTETAEEVWQTITFAVNSSLSEALFSVTTPFPGSRLHEYVVAKGWQLPSRLKDYNYHQVNRPRMSRDEISPLRLAVYKKIANLYFYLHPTRISITLNYFKNLKGIRKIFLKMKWV
jgi:anaerobic magnesium-protoporphyrin IX monomethyl ester cyclase